jgi:hypothetical protein
MKRMWNNVLGMLLMAPEGDGSGGSGAGGASFFTAPEGGGQVPPNQGNASPPQGAGGNAAAVPPGAGNNPPGPAATDWRSSLPKELQEDASIKKFSDVSTLAKSYINAQKLIGADKIAIPGDSSTEEDWTNAYRKLGLPETVDKYDVKFKEGVSLDKEFMDKFKAEAFKAGVLPKQAQALASLFSDMNLTAEKVVQGEIQKKFAKDVEDMKKEWGNSYDLNISRAKKVLNELGGAEVIKSLNTSGVGANKDFLKLMAKVGETLYAEHKFVENQGAASTLAPADIDKEIRRVQADPAYMNKNHPNHKALVEEVQALYQQRYPTKK